MIAAFRCKMSHKRSSMVGGATRLRTQETWALSRTVEEVRS
jgi:hypothetical protein